MGYKRLKSIKKLRFYLCGVLLVLVSVFIYPSVAKSTDEVNFLHKGLTLSPVRNEIKITPGASFEGSLSITNSLDQQIEVYLNAEEFSVINQNYDYAFTDESDVAGWVRFDTETVALQSQQSYIVKYIISVPLMAEPGGRYISIFASTETNVNSGIKSRQRIASLLYIDVTGEVSRLGKLIALNNPWLVFNGGDWSASLQNSGTTHYVSRYKVSLSELIGSYVVSDVSGDAMVLPGTVRLINDKLPVFSWPGVYKLTFEVGLGDTPGVRETRYVLYLPYYAIVILIFLFVTILFVLRRKKIV